MEGAACRRPFLLSDTVRGCAGESRPGSASGAALVARLPWRNGELVLRQEHRLAEERELVAKVAEIRRDLVRLHHLGHVALGEHLMVAGPHLDLGAPEGLELAPLPGLDELVGVQAARALDRVSDP